jgi:hypothetical protein
MKNAGKSQMAAGLMRQIAGDAVDVRSAGTRPGTALNELSVASLLEVGVGITGEHPKALTDEMVRAADVVVTLGPDARVDEVEGIESRPGSPTSPPNAASTASSGCAWSATTSPPGCAPWRETSAPHPRDRQAQRPAEACGLRPGTPP